MQLFYYFFEQLDGFYLICYQNSLITHTFFKIEFEFYSKAHLISPISIQFCSFAQYHFFQTKLDFFFVGVTHEFSSFGFSCNLTTLTIAIQAPRVVCHHEYLPSFLVPSFHNFDVLVKAFPMFFNHITQVLWEIVQVCMLKMNFQTHATSKRFKTSKCVFYDVLAVRILR